MPNDYKVPYLPSGSIFGEAEIEAVRRTLMSGKTLSCGLEREAFEEEFAAFVGVPYAVSVTNCTVALELATYLAQVRPGDEVIAATQTYQATIQHLLGSGVTVKFCDIDANTLNIDPDCLASLIGPRTRALYLVHYGGASADMAPIMDLADRHGITVIEDCAHSVGATYRGRMPGGLGHIGCFSFQSYKNISTLGEGGMLTFKDERWNAKLRRIRAIEPDADFRPRTPTSLGSYAWPADEIERHDKNAYSEDCVAVRYPGTNSTLAEPAAAVGRVQLRRLSEFLERRTQIANRLDAGLSAIPGIRVQQRNPDAPSAHHLYTCFLDPDTGLDRDAIARVLNEDSIEIQLRYFPLHLLPEWRASGHGLGECQVAERVWFHEQLNLPIYPQMADWQVEYMIERVAAAVSGG